MGKRTKGAGKGTTIWVTHKEKALLAEGKELFARFTETNISWGAYLCALSMGAIAAKAIAGILIRCPECEHEVEMKLVNPRFELPRRTRQDRKTVLSSQTPRGAFSNPVAPRL